MRSLPHQYSESASTRPQTFIQLRVVYRWVSACAQRRAGVGGVRVEAASSGDRTRRPSLRSRGRRFAPRSRAPAGTRSRAASCRPAFVSTRPVAHTMWVSSAALRNGGRDAPGRVDVARPRTADRRRRRRMRRPARPRRPRRAPRPRRTCCPTAARSPTLPPAGPRTTGPAGHLDAEPLARTSGRGRGRHAPPGQLEGTLSWSPRSVANIAATA